MEKLCGVVLSICFFIVRKPGNSFFFVDRERKPTSISEIVKVMMDVNPSESGSPGGTTYKPFIQSLTPSVTRQRQASRSNFRTKPLQSVTGLFDSPNTRYYWLRSLIWVTNN